MISRIATGKILRDIAYAPPNPCSWFERRPISIQEDLTVLCRVRDLNMYCAIGPNLHTGIADTTSIETE